MNNIPFTFRINKSHTHVKKNHTRNQTMKKMN